jgi:hypothetical protein
VHARVVMPHAVQCACVVSLHKGMDFLALHETSLSLQQCGSMIRCPSKAV